MQVSGVKKITEIIEWEGRHPVIASFRSRNRLQLKFKCPSCGHLVAHGAGGPKFGDGNGHRLAGGHGHGKACEFFNGYCLREVDDKSLAGLW